MKHEILKKTLLYRLLSFGLTQFITTLILFHNPFLSLGLTLITELGAVSLYYVYEYCWRRYIESRRIKKGTNLLQLEDSKVNIAYNVLEVLDDNKFIIEVV